VESRVYLWLHLLAFAVYMGATVAVVLIGVPLARTEQDARRRLRVVAAFMRVYDPLTIAALGVLVMTGAFDLTLYKEALRAAFFERVGTVLAWKLFFAFLLINLAAYIAFGIGHRLVRSAEGDQPVDAAWVDSMLRRLRVSACLALALTALIVWIALQMNSGTASLPASPPG
jgi:uncharacterized membrane protein